MKDIAIEIRDIVNHASRSLAMMRPEENAAKISADEWSKKEILGHLIDSAANNHQRFVRACYNAAGDYPPYNQTEWVRIQQYANMDWVGLIDLWVAYNRHLANLIERLPQEALPAPVNIGKPEPVTLEFVVKDYLRHLKHHMGDLLK